MNTRNTLWFAVAVLVLGASCSPPTSEEQPYTPQQNEILWDRWGVPHIFARDNESLFYELGWAQMRSHANLILQSYGEARGRAAEYWGEDHLEWDRWARTVGFPGRGREWYEAQAQPFRSYLDAFARGINDYATDHQEEIQQEMRQVLPVTGADVLSHGQRVIHFEFVTRPQVAERVEDQLERSTAGSNAWAIGPEHSATGNAMLLANPHLPWSGFYTWYEIHLVSPDVDVYGAVLVGNPFVGIGFNRHLGWSHTVNTLDGQDLYALTLSGDSYRWEGGLRPLQMSEEEIQVLQDDGSFRTEKMTVKRSVHGPVIAEEGRRAVALRVVGLYESKLFEQYWDMSRARNLSEFEKAISRLQMPMFTVIYADRDGHILSLFGGQIPRRPPGDWNWSGLVPGDTGDSLWTETHPYEELPRVVDPPTGWVQNANEPPWTTTLPYALEADEFPAYFAPRFMNFRSQRSARMLQEDASISFEELVEYKHSTRMELADRILDDLLAAPTQADPLTRKASRVLESWDRQADAESRGAVLFNAFWGELAHTSGRQSPFSEPWSERSPRTTPDGLSNPRLALEALRSAAVKIERDYGALDVPWGEVFRLRRGSHDFPANGGPGNLGIFRVLHFREGQSGRQEAFAGDSFVALVEFSNPVKARVLTAYGNSSNPGSPHYGDQLALFARKEMRTAWLTRSEIEANLAERESFD